MGRRLDPQHLVARHVDRGGTPLDRGTYVEICRGRHVITGRVIWRMGRHVGLRSQDRIDIDAIIARPDEPLKVQPNGLPERRWQAREPVETTLSSAIGAHSQKAALGLAGLAAACLIAGLARQALEHPFASVREALAAESLTLVAEVQD